MPIEREVISVSLSPQNDMAMRLKKLLADANIPPRQRSATIIAWAVGYAEGRTIDELPIADADDGVSKELLAKLDDL